MEKVKKLSTLLIVNFIFLLSLMDATTLANKKITNPHPTISTGGHTRSEYPSMAKISCLEAIKSALSQVRGKVVECKLENEDGFLVLGIEIVTPGGVRMEVQIDAGSGSILAVEKDEPENDLDELCKELGCD